MLKQLSKLERTRNVLILGFVGLMAVSLVLFFRPNSGSSQIEPTRSSEVLAAVGGEEITVGEFATQKQRIQQQFSQFGGQISLMQMGYTDEKILDSLIMKKVAVLEARRLGLGASEGEVKERIANTFRDPTGKFLLLDASGKFDMSRYQERVGDISMFERSVADDIAREKLEAFITAAKIDWLGVFTYSDEEGAKAFELADELKVPNRTIQSRRRKLMKLQQKISTKSKAAWVGREIDLLVEGESEETPLLWEGRTALHAPEIDGKVFINDFGPHDTLVPGTFYRAEITESHDYDVGARILE